MKLSTKTRKRIQISLFSGTTHNNLNNDVQIIAMSNEESNSIIEGETIELVIPEGTDVRNIVTIETSKVHQINE